MKHVTLARRMRNLSGLSQVELAKALGLSRKSVQSAERRILFTREHALRYFAFFGCEMIPAEKGMFRGDPTFNSAKMEKARERDTNQYFVRLDKKRAVETLTKRAEGMTPYECRLVIAEEHMKKL